MLVELKPYSQHFNFFTIYKWTQSALVWHCYRLKRLSIDKQSSLLGPLVSYEGNEVLWTRPQKRLRWRKKVFITLPKRRWRTLLLFYHYCLVVLTLQINHSFVVTSIFPSLKIHLNYRRLLRRCQPKTASNGRQRCLVRLFRRLVISSSYSF